MVESYHHMAVTLPLAISRMEGAHERPRVSVYPSRFSISECRKTAACVIWPTYSSLVVPGSRGGRSMFAVAQSFLRLAFRLVEPHREACVSHDVTLSFNRLCTGHMLDMYIDRLERRPSVLVQDQAKITIDLQDELVYLRWLEIGDAKKNAGFRIRTFLDCGVHLLTDLPC